MTTNITPLHDRVIVKRIDEGEQVRGGIIIPDSAKEKPQEGEVIAAGEGKYKEDGTRQPLDVKAGDRILFGKYTSSEIKIDGEELLIMREDEILGIITRAGAAVGGKKSTYVLVQRKLLVCERNRGWQFSPTGLHSKNRKLTVCFTTLIWRKDKNYGKANSSW
jgi:chaperonin GroES